MDHRERTIQDVLLPLSLGILGNVVVVLGTLFVSQVSSVPWWIIAAAGVTAVLLATLLARRSVRRRYVTLKVLQEVSSSRCGDYFLRLASLYFGELRRTDRAIHRLTEVVGIRKYPCRRFLDDIRALTEPESDTRSASRAALGYLNLVPSVRRLAREDVLEQLAQFLRKLPSETVIVLYGYSSTVCEGLARCASWLTHPVFLVEDLQYGVEGSLGEHRYARRHLEAAGIRPILLPFDQIAPLSSRSGDFVRDARGNSVPLSVQRRVIALLGCEAVDISSQVLIPSRIRGTPSETAKFIEVFHQAAQGDTSPADVVVVAESYKAYDGLDAKAALSHAPVKAGRLRRALYVAGLRALPRALEVELVRLPSADVAAIIDDGGVHRTRDGADMGASYRLWQERTVRRVQEPGGQVQLGRILSRARVAIFDFNGVLVDDEAVHFAAFGDALRNVGATLTYDEYLTYCSGRTDREGMDRLIRTKGLTEGLESLVEAKRAAYARHRGDFRPLGFRGALDVARALHERGVISFLVTSSDAETAREFVSSCGLEPVFPADRCFFEVDSSERPAAYQAILRDTREDPARCVVFDDTPGNLESARVFGVTTVAVATTHAAGRLSADVVINGPLSMEEATRGCLENE